MPRHGQGPERADMASVLESDEAEGDEDEENGLLVHMPPEQEGGIAAQCHGADESVPGRTVEKFQ